jgi:acyl-coenzyme A thioesterase PaaI-like protein
VTVTRAALARVLAGSRFNRLFGFRLAAASDGRCVLDVPYRAAFDRHGGLVSGPVFMAAADAAFWLAVLTRGGVADPAVTTELGTSFLAGARREGFRCRARVLRWGRRRIWGIAECTAADGRLLTHHTVGYLRPDGGSLRPDGESVQRDRDVASVPSERGPGRPDAPPPRAAVGTRRARSSRAGATRARGAARRRSRARAVSSGRARRAGRRP